MRTKKIKWERDIHSGTALAGWDRFFSQDTVDISFLNLKTVTDVDKKTAKNAFHPKWANMNERSQLHFEATMSIGGAAYGVRVPPMEILTNNNAMVAYIKF